MACAGQERTGNAWSDYTLLLQTRQRLARSDPVNSGENYTGLRRAECRLAICGDIARCAGVTMTVERPERSGSLAVSSLHEVCACRYIAPVACSAHGQTVACPKPFILAFACIAPVHDGDPVRSCEGETA